MRIAVNCPYCKRTMATSAAFAGQTIACPSCRGEFVFQPPATTPPPPSTSDIAAMEPPALQLDVASEQGAALASSATAVATPPRDFGKFQAALVSPPAAPRMPTPPPQNADPVATTAPPVPSPPTNTARFKTSTSAAATLVPAADGKLPGLLLADAEGAVRGESGEKSVPLWLACVAVVGSTLLSVFLLLGDSPGTQTTRSKHADARAQIAQFYGNDSAPLKPFQVLLREAQLAHSRGDRPLERQRYRQVLGLLRSEKRSKYETITGTPSDDEQLAQCLSVLLSND